MIKHKVKYRVVGADRAKRKYSINLDDGASFQLSRELLQGSPAQEGSKPLCSMTIQNGALFVRSGADQNDITFNSKAVRECEVRPGDLVQVEEFSIEILECPHAVRNETNATQFLDVSEIFGSAAKSSEPAPASSPAPTHAEPAASSVSSQAARESFESTPASDAPVSDAPAPDFSSSNVMESPAPSAAAFVNTNDIPAFTEATETPPEVPVAHEAPAITETHQNDKWSSQQAWEADSAARQELPPHEAQTRVMPAPAQTAEAPTHESPAHHRSRSPRASSSLRDTERHSTYRQSKRAEAPQTKKRQQQESSPTSSSESDFSHIAISAGMAAFGVAVSTRVLLSGSSTPQGMVVACAALSSIPVVLGMSLGLSKLNDYMGTEAHLREYSRFLGWTMICAVPWAYTQGASFPIAIFTTLLTSVLVSVAFVARFRPNMARFSAVGAGFSVVALAALITQHHYAANQNLAQEPLSTDTPSTETAAAAPASPANASAPAASAAPLTTAPAGSVAQVGTTGTQPSLAQPQGAAALAQQGAPQVNPVIPSAVNDTIPPIPTHADVSASAGGALTRAPAAVDPSAKGIIDPLAHEEFFSAIKMGNLEVVKSLIDRKQVDPDFTLDKGSTPLIVAAASGRMKVVEYLLRRRVNINAQDPHGTTALMWAVFKGHRDVAKFLISKGADAKVIRDDGDTAMDIARKWRQTEIVALLKEASSENGMMSKKSRSTKTRSSRRRR